MKEWKRIEKWLICICKQIAIFCQLSRLNTLLSRLNREWQKSSVLFYSLVHRLIFCESTHASNESTHGPNESTHLRHRKICFLLAFCCIDSHYCESTHFLWVDSTVLWVDSAMQNRFFNDLNFGFLKFKNFLKVFKNCFQMPNLSPSLELNYELSFVDLKVKSNWHDFINLWDLG